jgi:hypothetical protein
MKLLLSDDLHSESQFDHRAGFAYRTPRAHWPPYRIGRIYRSESRLLCKELLFTAVAASQVPGSQVGRMQLDFLERIVFCYLK